MKYALWVAFLCAIPVHAEETASESHFQLYASKCQADIDTGPESTPQSPPLTVDDPETPGCNRWEINVLADGDLTTEERNWELPLLDVNYGIGDNIQLKYEVPYVLRQSADSTSNAVGESVVGIKHMFYDNESNDMQMSVYPQLTFTDLSRSAVDNGLATPGTIVTLPLLMSMKIGQTGLGDIKLTVNLGYNLSSKPDEPDFVSAAVGVGYPLFREVSLLGEIVTEQAVRLGPDSIRDQIIKANLGFIGTISRHFLLFGSLGHSLYASDLQNHTYVLAGMQILVGEAQSAGPVEEGR